METNTVTIDVSAKDFEKFRVRIGLLSEELDLSDYMLYAYLLELVDIMKEELQILHDEKIEHSGVTH